MPARVSPYWLWGLLGVFPAVWGFEALTSDNARIFHILVHPTGEWSARLLILTLAITPLTLLFRGNGVVRWLRANRRSFGVAAFAYAAMHVAFYLIDKSSLARVAADVPRLYIWTGWLAFAIFIPLAATSMDLALRKLGPRWKSLQRWTYVAAVLTLVHWASLHDWGHPMAAVLHFAPLAALESYRIWYWYLRPRAPVAGHGSA
jgi:methionine sulfoxide reductase heme-binding subunit